APGATTGTPTQTTPGSPYLFAGVTLASRTLTLSGRSVKVTLRCPAGTNGRCAGQLTLTAHGARTALRRAYAVRLGRASLAIAAGRQVTIRVPVSRAGLAMLKNARRLGGDAAISASDGAGRSKTTAAALTIKHRLPRR